MVMLVIFSFFVLTVVFAQEVSLEQDRTGKDVERFVALSFPNSDRDQVMPRLEFLRPVVLPSPQPHIAHIVTGPNHSVPRLPGVMAFFGAAVSCVKDAKGSVKDRKR